MQAMAVTKYSSESLTSLVGLAARYPKSVHSRGQGDRVFWDAMTEGLDLSSRVPLERWDIDHSYSPELANKKM